MPKVDPIERAEQQVATARANLEQALERGEDSTGPRADLDHALASLDAARAAQAQPEAAEQPDTTIDEQADAMAMEAALRISDQLAPLAAIEAPMVKVPVSAARDLIAAQRQADSDRKRQEAHQERVANLQQRIADLEQQRQQIIDRRLAGQAEDGDAGQITLIELDVTALRELLTRVQTERPVAAGISAAAREWDQAQAMAEMRARSELIASLQAKLVAVAEIQPRPPYGERVRLDPRVRELTLHGTWG